MEHLEEEERKTQIKSQSSQHWWFTEHIFETTEVGNIASAMIKTGYM